MTDPIVIKAPAGIKAPSPRENKGLGKSHSPEWHRIAGKRQLRGFMEASPAIKQPCYAMGDKSVDEIGLDTQITTIFKRNVRATKSPAAWAPCLSSQFRSIDRRRNSIALSGLFYS